MRRTQGEHQRWYKNSTEKVQVVLDFQSPTTLKQLMSFLGMVRMIYVLIYIEDDGMEQY